jgi:hypothetical protein
MFFFEVAEPIKTIKVQDQRRDRCKYLRVCRCQFTLTFEDSRFDESGFNDFVKCKCWVLRDVK